MSTRSYTQQDPIGIAGGLNLYGFAGGDPVNFSDPFGLAACDPPDEDCATVELVVRQTEHKLGGLVATGHAFIKVTEADGSIYTYSAGPSAPVYGGSSEQGSRAVGNSAPGGITLAAGGRTPWAVSGERAAIDGGAGVVMSIGLASVSQSELGGIYSALDAFSSGVNAAGIAYQPRGTNSNAFAYSAASFVFGADNASAGSRGGLPWGSGARIRIP